MPPETTEIRRNGFHFRVEADERVWLEEEVIARLDDLERLPGVTLVKRNNVRTVLRVPVAGRVLYVKRYHVRGLKEWLKYLVVPSRAVAEWRAARGLREAGLPVVSAVLMGEKRSVGILRDGCLATREIEGGSDFVPWLNRHLSDPGRHRERREILVRLARLVRRLHDAGFSHGDLHGGNILVSGDPRDSRIHLLDLHTVSRRHRVGPWARRRNLAKLLHSLMSVTNTPDCLRMIRAYEGAEPMLGEPRRTLSRLLSRRRALERRRLLSRSRRCLRRSSSFDLARIGSYLLYFRRELPSWAPLYAVGDHLHSDQTGGREVLKSSRRSALSRQCLPALGEPVPVVVKETRCRGTLDVVKNALRRPRALAAWVNGNGLRVRNVSVARPLAVVVEGRWPFRRAGWLLMEDLAEQERVDLHVLRRFARTLDRGERREKRDLVRAFGRFVGDLHRRGIYHGDLKAVNVFVRIDIAGEPVFTLVDYDRVRFGRTVSRRRRIKNLAQLAASVAVLITRTDRLRFFRAYSRGEAGRDEERSFARGVERACRKKIVVRMEPIE